jgi:hypothetical protein
MIRAIPATSALRNCPINRSKLVFSLPLVGYCFLAILVAFHPQAPWVVAILGSPLVLGALAVNRRALQRAARGGSCTGHGPSARPIGGEDAAVPFWIAPVLDAGAGIGVGVDQRKAIAPNRPRFAPY